MPMQGGGKKKVSKAEPTTHEVPMSFRLDERTAALIRAVAAQMGVSQRDVLRMSVRAFAKRQGVELG